MTRSPWACSPVLYDAGEHTPDDVSAGGFDDPAVAAKFLPSLTTARQDFAGLDVHVVAQLDAVRTGEAPLAVGTVARPYRSARVPQHLMT